MINKYDKSSMVLSSQLPIQYTDRVRASLFGCVKNICEISYGSILDILVKILLTSDDNTYSILQIGFECHELIELRKNLFKSGACWFVHDVHSLVISSNDDVEVVKLDFLLYRQHRISFRHSQQSLVMPNPKDLRSFAAGTGGFLNHTLITTHMTTLQEVWKFLLIQTEMAVALRAFLKPVFVGNVVQLMDSIIEELLVVDVCGHFILNIGIIFLGDLYRGIPKKSILSILYKCWPASKKQEKIQINIDQY